MLGCTKVKNPGFNLKLCKKILGGELSIKINTATYVKLYCIIMVALSMQTFGGAAIYVG